MYSTYEGFNNGIAKPLLLSKDYLYKKGLYIFFISLYPNFLNDISSLTYSRITPPEHVLSNLIRFAKTLNKKLINWKRFVKLCFWELIMFMLFNYREHFKLISYWIYVQMADNELVWIFNPWNSQNFSSVTSKFINRVISLTRILSYV